MIVALENAFQIVFNDDALTPETFETAGALWNAVQTLR
jgi:acyl carrier protein